MANISFALWFVIISLIIIVIVQHIKINRIKNNLKLIEKIKNTLYYVADEIAKTSRSEEVYELILDAAISLIPDVSKGSVLILEDDGLFHYKVVKGFSEGLKKTTLKKEEAFLYRINNFRETAIIKNPLKFDEDVVNSKKIYEMKEFEAFDISCSLSSPIYIDDQLVGLINLDSTKDRKSFSREDINLMNHIKNELQLALKNSDIQNKLRYMANYDELTGLYNRRCFKSILNKELDKIKRYKTKGCLALIDIDDFKRINDNYGHNMGDKALKFFAQVLRDNVRKSDVYARMSGDEFVILFINCDFECAKEKMEKIRAILKDKHMGALDVSFSYGICVIDNEVEITPDDIFGEADRKMYLDKDKKSERRSY